MKLINICDAIRAVDRHTLEDGTLDNDISCILEEVTPVMIPQKASSSCSHEKDTISRQAAIDALQTEINKGIPPFDDVMGSIRCGVRLARNIIEDLPSAQPYTDEEIQKIQELEEAQFDKIRELAYQDGKADAMAKIIHCKDCYYRYGRYCHYRYTNGLFISADHYCGFAKRQEDDK